MLVLCHPRMDLRLYAMDSADICSDALLIGSVQCVSLVI